MKRVVWLIPAILILFSCATAKAQETPVTPVWEVSGGYSYLRANLGGSNFHLNGGTISAAENLNSWFGGRLEINLYQGNSAGRNVAMQTFTYGPVFSYRRFQRFTPFAHAQFGAVHASQGYLGISQSATKFAMSGGGGVDFKLNQRAAIRAQGDYLMTTFLALRQDNAQASVALVIRFGSK